MAVVDLDSHLRDGSLLDEIYQLPEPYTQGSPKRIGDDKIQAVEMDDFDAKGFKDKSQDYQKIFLR